MSALQCPGFEWSGLAAGIKKNQARDLGLIWCQTPAAAAAVFTRNRVKAAPVLLSAEHIQSGRCQAIIVNSGNANCCNGPRGLTDARTMARETARALNIDETLVLVASTGVIGQPLPIGTISTAIPGAVRSLSEDGLADFADSILTTDNGPKIESVRARLDDGSTFTITAAAKGAGMICPDMATMLCFVGTDIQATPGELKAALNSAVAESFNCITVDGDTSTNDTVFLLASGQSQARLTAPPDRRLFQEQLSSVLRGLARRMVQDGEGATRVMEVLVAGASSDAAARQAADTVANSVLVKTALFGQDANWGRIMAALGRSRVDFDPERVDLFFDQVQLVSNGQSAPAPAEENAAAVLQKPECRLTIDLKTRGKGRAAVLTCDLSLDYVKLNADYRTSN